MEPNFVADRAKIIRVFAATLKSDLPEAWSARITRNRNRSLSGYDYLVDVLQRIDQYPAKDIAPLTPRLWWLHFADDPLRSVLHRQRP